jgi:hypothetical protein
MTINNYKTIACLFVLLGISALTLINRAQLWPRYSAQKIKIGAVNQHNVQTKEDIVSESAIATIQNSIAEREYHISLDKKVGKFQSPNRKQNLRAYYEPGRLIIKNRIDSAGHNFKMSISNVGIYADGKKLNTSDSEISTSVTDNVMRIRRGAVSEEYINSESGVRQNFIVHSAPSKTSNLQVRLIAHGLRVEDSGQNKLIFYDKDSNGLAGNLLTYDSLKCWDANGKILEASLGIKDSQIVINVNASDAIYPVTIDPIIANGNPGNANAVLEGAQTTSLFGWYVSSAGDINGDGYSDVLCGAPNYDDVKIDQGAFFVFMGSSTGLGKGKMFLGSIDESGFGSKVSSAGDVNGDGFSDILVSADTKVTYLYNGSANGLSLTSKKITVANDPVTFGQSIAPAGDVNGDGFSDIAIGARFFSFENNFEEGAVFIYEGSASGIGDQPSDTLRGYQAGAEFGFLVAGAGDVNGDGYSDLIVGSVYYDTQQHADAGAAFIFHGSALGVDHSAKVILPGKHFESLFGYSVSSAGDINGDGYSDVMVGAKLYENGQAKEGAAFIYLASADGSGIDPKKETKIESNQSNALLGEALSCAGDMNGDGFSDIIICAPSYDHSTNGGRASIYFGSKVGINLSVKSQIISGQPGAKLGQSVASAGDINGDGYSDIIIGVPNFDKSAASKDDGLALVFHGSASSVTTTPVKSILGNQLQSGLGFAVSDAGDVNGDGFDDVLVGAPSYDNGEANEGVAFLCYGSLSGIETQPGSFTLIEMNQAGAQFGRSVSGAGDTNGDGYDDIVIGANLYDMPGASNGGAAFVFYGSQTGVSLAIKSVIHINQGAAQAGFAVSTAGDVNGDGYADVIIGAPFYSSGQNGEGAAILSLGSANGISNGKGIVLERNQASAEFGNAVSEAGDVNGDGYSDVIVGAHHFENNASTSNEGGCFVYYGSKTGINAASATLLEIDKVGAWLGYSVSKAGDINGDGFDDVVAGAIYYSNGQANEGAAVLFYGAKAGMGNGSIKIVESNQADAMFGSSVSSGDFNGDGYSDLALGASSHTADLTNEGAVFVYDGSQTGLISINRVELQGDQSDCQMGISVSSAGDVNGDGYVDLIAGASKYMVGASENGAALVFHGNGETPIAAQLRNRNKIQVYNEDLTNLLSQSNIKQGSFGVGLNGHSFLGRNLTKLVWETRKQGESFSKSSPITNSTQFTDQGSFEATTLGETELKASIKKPGANTKIRVRIKNDPALAITGQVYGPWRYISKGVLATESALPVTLISFHAQAMENHTRLEWTTASETNSDYYEIQRSVDGKRWGAIGKVEAAENSQGHRNYNFTDFNPLKGSCLYRLKMVDSDASFAFSSVESVNFDDDETTDIVFFPNPVRTLLNIDSKSPVRQLEVYNSLGIKIISLTNPLGIKRIDMSEWPAASYLIIANGKSFHLIKK